jgi:excisionase family DNA binding protein
LFKSPMLSATTSEIMTLEEVADYLRLPVDSVLRQAQQGKLPGRQIEDQWRFLRSAIDAWLNPPNSYTALLQQAGALADDESLSELRNIIYKERNRSEVEEV